MMLHFERVVNLPTRGIGETTLNVVARKSPGEYYFFVAGSRAGDCERGINRRAANALAGFYKLNQIHFRRVAKPKLWMKKPMRFCMPPVYWRIMPKIKPRKVCRG